MSVTTLAATYLVYMSKVSQHTVSCRLLKISIMWTSLKTFHSGDMASFTFLDDRKFGSFSTRNTPMVLDMITNSIVAWHRSDDYLNLEQLSLDVLGSRLDSFLLTRQYDHDISTWFVPLAMQIANAAPRVVQSRNA